MTPARFWECNRVLAEDQPQYQPLPVHVAGDGRMTCSWQLTWRERLELLIGGRIWHQILTFNHPLQPQLLLTTKPELEDE